MRRSEKEAAALLRQEQAAIEMEQVHSIALRMNEQSRLVREYGLAVWVLGLGALGLLGYLLVYYSQK